MIQKEIFKTVILLCSILLLISCKKEGTGGKASITGLVKHHALNVPGATVYIKYGATEFPGIDPSKYDANMTTGSDARFEFKNLKKGNYFLFSIGYDTAIFQTVKGGMPVELTSKKEAKAADLPVVE